MFCQSGFIFHAIILILAFYAPVTQSFWDSFYVLSILLCSPVCQWPLITCLSMCWLICLSALPRRWALLAGLVYVCVLTCSSVCTSQLVSASCFLRFFLCYNLSTCLYSPVCECLTYLDSFCSDFFIHMCSSWWVPLAFLDSLHVLIYPYIYALQKVSSPHLLEFFSCPNLSIHLCSPVCEYSLIAQILPMFWCVHLCSLVCGCHLLGLNSFCILTCLLSIYLCSPVGK